MRSKWGSKLGFILATAGSAIGLGNIWRFPYLAGQYGGGVFLLTYLCCVGVLGYFMVTAKLAFGRATQTNIVDGFRISAEQNGIKVSRLWGIMGGWIGVLNGILVAAVYSIVIGWTASYVIEGINLFLGFSDKVPDADLFKDLTSSLSQQLFWCIVCITLTALVIIKGVKQGIERLSLYLMPFLFMLLLFMVIWMIFLPNSGQGILFFLTPDWSKMGFTSLGFRPDLFCDLVVTALGQAIYSLSLGMGVVFIYGSYLSKSTDIKNSARWIVGLDTMVAFLSGLIVLPAVFSFGLEAGQGPGLSFISLPLIFSKMAAGRFLMLLFFVLLFLSAITSLISIYEGVVSLMMDKLSLSRVKATVLMAVMNILTAVVVLLSSTGLWDISIGGKNLFDGIDKLTGSFTMALMIFMCCLFMGWKIYPVIIAEIGKGTNGTSKSFQTYLKWVLRLIAPAVIMIICLGALL